MFFAVLFFCFQPLYVFLSDPLSSSRSVLGLIFLSASDSCFAASQRAAHLGVIPLPVTVESEAVFTKHVTILVDTVTLQLWLVNLPPQKIRPY